MSMIKCHDCDHEWDIAVHGSDCPACGTPYSEAPNEVQDTSQVSTSRSSSRSTSSRSTTAITSNVSSLATIVGASGQVTRRRSLRSDSSIRSSSRKRGIGRGYVSVDETPPIDALTLVRPDLTIPVRQRICSNPNCVDEHGGRTRVGLKYTGGDNGNRNDDGNYVVLRDKGFCTKKECKTPYSFEPIAPDTLVYNSYQVKGPIAVGGCGFIYLAWDVNVGQYVILKGLINSKDQDALQAAMQERKFLADLRDPSVISIYNFVPHEDQFFIVMEFCDGTTLKNVLKGNGKPLPVTTALAYTLGVLESYKYLASRRPRVLYCDGKLDNFMVQGKRVRMLDLGGCRREDDDLSDYVYTIGYVAPEAGPDAADPTPSVASDLYTVIRCFMIMAMDFDWKRKYRYSCPPAAEHEVLQLFPSVHRLILKGLAKNPDERFQSAEELEEQLECVLREVAALESGQAKVAESVLFAADVHSISEATGFHLLPLLKVDEDDPARGMVMSAIALNDPKRQLAVFETAMAQFPKSTDAPLRKVHALIELNDFGQAEALIKQLTEKDPFDWRNVWMKGRLEMARKNWPEAYKCFDAVYSEIPGELAPKLAMALVLELKGDFETAIALYELVAKVNPNFTTAIFGLGRCLNARGDREGTVAAYDMVPPLSIAAIEAKAASVRALIRPVPSQPAEAQFIAAAERMAEIRADNFWGLRLRADLLVAAISAVEAGLTEKPGTKLMEVPLTRRDLCNAAEETLRSMAPLSEDPVACIIEANRLRNTTTF
jgi:serine/threonine-protein kinase PknG